MRTIMALGILVTTANGATFFPGTPNTNCPHTAFGNTLTIAAAPNGASFSVTGSIAVQITAGAAACFIEWEVESPFAEGPAAAMWTNTSAFGGTVVSPALGFMVMLTEMTEHENEAGTGVATAMIPLFAVVAGGNGFAAGPVNGAPFLDGPEADVLRQDFLINITPPAGGGLITFDFPVSSSTAAPEPATSFPLLASLLGLLAYQWRRKKLSVITGSVTKVKCSLSVPL